MTKKYKEKKRPYNDDTLDYQGSRFDYLGHSSIKILILIYLKDVIMFLRLYNFNFSLNLFMI